MDKPTRCINVDWLEVYALEPIDQPHNADYFRACGFEVMQRDYGTRIYEEMFKFLDVKNSAMIGGAAYQYPKYYIKKQCT